MNLKEITKQNKNEIVVVLIFIFFALGFNIYRVQGTDGFDHYRFLERILGLSNPECSVARVENTQFEQSGCAFFNAPFYLIAHGIERIFNVDPNFNGITLRQISINLASNFYLVLSLLLIIKILKRLNFKFISLPAISILFSTGAFAAAVVQPSWNQTVDIFVNTLIVYLFLKNLRENNAKKSIWLGLLIAIAILVRYANFMWLFSITAFFLISRNYKKAMFFILGFLCFIWTFPALLYTYGGSTSPFTQVNITFENIKFRGQISLTPKYILKYLVHPLHGLFIWSPATIFSALGLVFFPKEKKELGFLFVITWLFFLIFYGFIPWWHSGWSFSNRYLVGLFPIYIIGVAAFLERYGGKLSWLVILATTYSIILFFNWHLCIMNPEFETPADLIKNWVKGESSTFIGKEVNLKIFLRRLWEWCRYKYIFRIFK